MKRLDHNLRPLKKLGGKTTRRGFLKGSGLGLLAANVPLPVPPLVATTASDASPQPALFSPGAKWIRDGSDRWAYHRYIQARREFRLTPEEMKRISGGEHAARPNPRGLGTPEWEG